MDTDVKKSERSEQRPRTETRAVLVHVDSEYKESVPCSEERRDCLYIGSFFSDRYRIKSVAIGLFPSHEVRIYVEVRNGTKQKEEERNE
jgi:hypothetical protein